jgi:F-type H+-transporting ATPase subunit b
MALLLLLAQPGGGGQVDQIARTFGVDWPHFLAQVTSFAIVCALLYRFAYKRVLAMLEERRQEIARGLANADEIKAELFRTEAQRQEVMAEANAQATRLIEEARAAAGRVLQEETQKALAAGEQIVARAREATVQDQARMLAELRREVGRLVVQTAAAVTGKVLTPEDQRRLAEATARRLSA